MVHIPGSLCLLIVTPALTLPNFAPVFVLSFFFDKTVPLGLHLSSTRDQCILLWYDNLPRVAASPHHLDAYLHIQPNEN